MNKTPAVKENIARQSNKFFIEPSKNFKRQVPSQDGKGNGHVSTCGKIEKLREERELRNLEGEL